MTTYTFSGPTTKRIRKGKCPKCGKAVTRCRTFERTVNPFNRHPTEDRPKTWEEVRSDVHAAADAWQPDFTCQSCDFATDLDRMDARALLGAIGTEAHDRWEHHRAGDRATRVALCNQRIAVYEQRLLQLEPDRVELVTAFHWDRAEGHWYCCYFEFPSGQRCVYGARHGAGYHLSPTGDRVTLGGP